MTTGNNMIKYANDGKAGRLFLALPSISIIRSQLKSIGTIIGY